MTHGLSKSCAIHRNRGKRTLLKIPFDSARLLVSAHFLFQLALRAVLTIRSVTLAMLIIIISAIVRRWKINGAIRKHLSFVSSLGLGFISRAKLFEFHLFYLSFQFRCLFHSTSHSSSYFSCVLFLSGVIVKVRELVLCLGHYYSQQHDKWINYKQRYIGAYRPSTPCSM